MKRGSHAPRGIHPTMNDGKKCSFIRSEESRSLGLRLFRDASTGEWVAALTRNVNNTSGTKEAVAIPSLPPSSNPIASESAKTEYCVQQGLLLPLGAVNGDPHLTSSCDPITSDSPTPSKAEEQCRKQRVYRSSKSLPLRATPTEINKLFVLPNAGARSVPAARRQTNVEIMRIKAASIQMVFRDYLNFVYDEYNVHRLLPSHRRQCMVDPRPRPKDPYYNLVLLEAQYDSSNLHIEDASTYEIIVAIRGTLTWLRKVIDHGLQTIESQRKALPLRGFVSRAYRFHNVKSTSKFFDTSSPWNPRGIYCKNRVVKEAIAFYELPKFVNNEAVLSIYAKHIVFLLRGGKDWRTEVRPGDRFILQHPTQAQMSST